MRRLHLLAALLPLVPVSVAPAAAQDAPGEQTFVTLRGDDTVAVERSVRTPGALRGTLEPAGGVSVRWSAALAEDATVRRLEFAFLRGESTIAEGTAELGGDTVVARVRAPGAPPEQRIPAARGTMPYLNPSFALLEQAVRRARAIGGDSVRVPMLAVANGSAFPLDVVRLGADSVRLVLGPGVEMRVAADADGRLLGGTVPAQGLRIHRGDAPPPPAERPDYSAPHGAPYAAEEVRVPVPGGPLLAGTLTVPVDASASVPAVLLLTGSGPQERDEALPALPGYRPFRQVADALGRRGIAVLRLDDRGAGASEGEFAAATFADRVADARAAVAWLRARPEVDAERIALLGHSEGGAVAPAVAAEDGRIAALVLLAAPSRTGRELSDAQIRRLFAGRTDDPAERDSLVRAAIDARDEAARTDAAVRAILDIDPLPHARRVRAPVLILHGATDTQVPPEQAEELAGAMRAAGNAYVAAHVLPGLNHLFLPDPDGGWAGYPSLPDRNVPGEVLARIAGWLESRLDAAR